MEDFWIEHRYNTSGFQLKRHFENVYQILLVCNGRIRYRVGRQCYEAGRGAILVLNTLEEHDLKVLEYPYERYLIRVQPDFFENEVKYPEVIAAFIKRPPNFSHLLTVTQDVWNVLYGIVLEMEREYNQKKKYWALFVGADLRRLFIIIFRECASVMSMKIGRSVTVAYHIMNYINHHYTEELHVETIAAELGLNKNYISHVFKDETGYSLMAYVIALRINRAKLLLTRTDQRVTEIAAACGYDDFTYFSRQFKKSTGFSPTSYRNQYANLTEKAEFLTSQAY